MIGKQWTPGVCLLALAGLAGCSGSNDVLAPTGTEGVTQSITQTVVAPALEALDTFDLDQIVFGAPAPAVEEGGGGEGCADLSSSCTSGTLDLCFDSAGESYDFGNCVAGLNGKTYDGTIDFGQSSIQYALTVDGAAMNGSFAFAWDRSCLTETISDFSVTRSTSSTTMSGELTYCAGGTRPSGDVTFQSEGSFGSWLIQMTLDGTDTAQATVTDLATQTVSTCTIDLATGQTTCS